MRRSKKTSKLRVIGHCVGNSPVTSEFPAQRASYAENVSILWRHHGLIDYSVAQLPTQQSNVRAIGHPVFHSTWFWDFARFCGKTFSALRIKIQVGVSPVGDSHYKDKTVGSICIKTWPWYIVIYPNHHHSFRDSAPRYPPPGRYFTRIVVSKYFIKLAKVKPMTLLPDFLRRKYDVQFRFAVDLPFYIQKCHICHSDIFVYGLESFPSSQYCCC